MSTSREQTELKPPEQENFKDALSGKLSDFFEYTTAHGYGRLAQAKRIKTKLFWVCVLVCVNGLFLWQFIDRVTKYHTRPTKTIIKDETNMVLPFPQVTICNLNRIRKSKLPSNLLAVFPDILNSTAPTTGNKSGSGTDSILGPDDYEPLDFVKEAFSHELFHSPQDELIEAGHQLEDLVHQCTFKVKKCDRYTRVQRLWSHFWHKGFGNCYVFNGGMDNDTVLPTADTGPLGGLSLELNIERDEYMGKLSNEMGVQILISDQGSNNFPLEEGMSVPAGASVKIGMKKVTLSRLDPFSNRTCRQNDDIDDLGSEYKKRFDTYSQTACKMNCQANLQRDNCSCVQYDHAAMTDQVCMTLNGTVAQCLEESNMLYEKGFCAKFCPPSCSRSIFRIINSVASWPSDEYTEILASSLDMTKRNISKVDVSDNMLKLSVYFEDLNVETIEETLSYDLGSLISDVGGILGMFTGVSFLTCAELLELLGLIVVYLLQRANKRTQTAPRAENIDVKPMANTA